MLIGWSNTLMQAVADITDLESVPDVGAFISKIREIAAKFIRLLTVLKEVKSLQPGKFLPFTTFFFFYS
jgi:prolactin